MLLIPAIDLRGGRCVRLHQGDFAQETVFSDNPLETARRWGLQGATRLHLVDLDAAGETGDNRAVIAEITSQMPIEVEVGGGLRSMADLEEIFTMGASHAIIGTAAYRDPDFVAEAVGRFPGQIILGLDARDGMVAIRGWKEIAQISAIEMGQHMRQLGIETVIYTDISRDGTLSGPNLASSVDLAQKTGLKVIVSGGISKLADLAKIDRLAKQDAGITGAILGKAIYTGAIDLTEAIKLYGGGTSAS